MTRLVVGTLLAVAITTLAGLTPAQQPATPLDNRTAHEIASLLRCVVCQNLSVADSPSEMAAQMRAIVRERLAAGERPDQVIQYFVERYGEWILLAPRRRGFTLLVWLFPAVAVGVGLVITALVIRRWTRRARAERGQGPSVDPRMQERIRREMEMDA